MPRKKEINTKYSPEFKITVIMDMRQNHLGYRTTARKYFESGQEGKYKNYINRM